MLRNFNFWLLESQKLQQCYTIQHSIHTSYKSASVSETIEEVVFHFWLFKRTKKALQLQVSAIITQSRAPLRKVCDIVSEHQLTEIQV